MLGILWKIERKWRRKYFIYLHILNLPLNGFDLNKTEYKLNAMFSPTN
jgi:hypothetical protein